MPDKQPFSCSRKKVKSQSCHEGRIATNCFLIQFIQNKDLIAMETVLAPLACCLLVLSFDLVHTENSNLPTTTLNPGLPSTSSDSTVPVTSFPYFTKETTEYTSTKINNETLNTTATTENTSHLQSSPSATTLISPTDSASLKTTPNIQTPTLTMTTHEMYPTTNTSVSPTENSSQTVFTTIDSAIRTTQGWSLNASEQNMTIIFSVMLGVFLLALVVFILQKCRQRVQYVHQPLNNTSDTDGLVVDNDTLVISGGLYDGHPIYDNVPPVPSEPSQFRLEFLH